MPSKKRQAPIQFMISSLNSKINSGFFHDYIPEAHHNKDISAELETILRDHIEEAFGITETVKKNRYQGIKIEDLKKLYHELARSLNTDHTSTEPFMELLRAHGYARMPQAQLNKVWAELQLTAAGFQQDLSLYNKFNFLIKQANIFGLTIKAIDASTDKSEKLKEYLKQKAFKTFDDALRTSFPSWYAYENYTSSRAKNFVIYYAIVINTLLFSAYVVRFAAYALYGIIVDVLITNTLLSIALMGQHLPHAAKYLALRRILMTHGVGLETTPEEEYIDIYNTLFHMTPASQDKYLNNSFRNLSTVSQETRASLFECCYIYDLLTDINQKDATRSFIDVGDLDKFDQLNFQNKKDIIQYLTSNTQHFQQQRAQTLDAMLKIYIQVRKSQASSLAMETAFSYMDLSSYQKIYSVACGLQTMLADEQQPLLHKILRGLLFVATSPLFFASCVYSELSVYCSALLIGIKELSVQLTNAPLNIHAFFSPSPTEDATNNMTGEMKLILNGGNI